ncbi:MAG: rhomboid family intramembrane serine protease [bacterium]
MSFRRRFQDWSESPATYSVAAAWVMVYLVMLCGQAMGILPKPDAAMFREMGPLGMGAISETSGRLFGSWNSAEILSGQVWRAVCATFIHFGVIHIALNTFGLIQLGRLIEEWYGPRLFFVIIILTGFLGNFAAALARPIMAEPSANLLFISSGGGSTVVFGLIGLVAVVGKRSRSRMGLYLYRQMVGLLVFNFLIGLTIPQIDNFAHAGGALAGAIIGMMHYKIMKINDLWPRFSGVLLGVFLLLTGTCVVGQVWVCGVEESVRRQDEKILQVEQIDQSLQKATNFYKNRVVLGLNVFQVVQQKPRVAIALPWFAPMLVPMSPVVIEENRKLLDQEIDVADQLIRRLGILPVNLAWEPLKAEFRLAVARPPLAQEISDMEKKLARFRKTEGEILVEIIRLRQLREARMILWRMPLPGVGWQNNEPYLIATGPPKNRDILRLPDGRNRPADLPAGESRVMPGPEFSASQR